MASAGDLTGELIADKYELLRLIGRGGMGAVYEARNVATLRRCAVKVLVRPELAGDGEVVKRFFREAKASGLIESEHVVAAFDSGIDAAERVYYVMECLQGEDLEQTLGRLGQINPRAAMKIVLQAATGLASAHALGVVHRDVKPANLFLALGANDEVKVKILDFGVAKVKMEVFNESVTSLTHGGTLLGTPLYISPEQLRRASAIEESTDVWSLGVVLFECLTGESPWGSCDGIGELVTAILTLPLPSIQELAPWVRPELAEVVQRTLLRDPGLRLHDGAELRDALAKLLGGDTRLFLHEICEPDEHERRSLAPRLSMADGILLGPTPHSGVPVVTTAAPLASRRGASLRVMLGAFLLALSLAWTLAWGFGGRVDNVPRQMAASALFTVTSAPMPIAPNPAPSVEAPLSKSFELEVGPLGARVTVDGVGVGARNGKVKVEGAVGSVHDVRVNLGGRARSERVVITEEGLLPARIMLELGKPAAPKQLPAEPAIKPPPAPRPLDSAIPPGLISNFE